MIFLRKLREEDFELILKWKKNTSYLNKEHSSTIEFQKKWLLDIQTDENCKYWIISSSSIKIGIANINHIDNSNKTCNLECIIEDKHFKNRGIAQIVILNLLDYGFNEMNMDKIYINMSEKNNIFDDKFSKSVIEGENKLFNSNLEFFGHKFVCIKKSDWSLFEEKKKLERICVD